MNFLESFLENDLVGNSSTLIISITIFFILVALAAFYFDFLKNKDNSNKISILERAIKDLLTVSNKNIEMKIITPFGPKIGKSKIPSNIVKRIKLKLLVCVIQIICAGHLNFQNPWQNLSHNQ